MHVLVAAPGPLTGTVDLCLLYRKMFRFEFVLLYAQENALLFWHPFSEPAGSHETYAYSRQIPGAQARAHEHPPPPPSPLDIHTRTHSDACVCSLFLRVLLCVKMFTKCLYVVLFCSPGP